MQNKYYYLVASLPNLKFGDEPPISRERFAEECAKWLTERDMAVLRAAAIRCTPARCDGVSLLSKWKDFEGGFREALALTRSARKKGEEPKMTEDVRAVMAQEDPLGMEKFLEKRRWDFLDDIAHEYFFDLNRLIVYHLQLQILERLATFNKDKGESRFYELCGVDYEERER